MVRNLGFLLAHAKIKGLNFCITIVKFKASKIESIKKWAKETKNNFVEFKFACFHLKKALNEG